MGFSPDWLALREPIDHISRDAELLALAAVCAPEGAVVLDLGSGTGSTARAFGGTVAARWQWRFVDGAAELLEIAGARHPGSAQVLMDLRDIDRLPLEGVDLVTASALLDLMPQNWVEALAQRLRDAQIPFYAALNYNGVMHWTPAHASDAGVNEAFNTHQRGDKGIGPALGPASGTVAARIFTDHGFDVQLGDSPWELGAGDAPLHRELLVGIGSAAAEAGFPEAKEWAAERAATVAQTAGYIGHTDLLALPACGGQ